jgi:hypothetical protein
MPRFLWIAVQRRRDDVAAVFLCVLSGLCVSILRGIGFAAKQTKARKNHESHELHE